MAADVVAEGTVARVAGTVLRRGPVAVRPQACECTQVYMAARSVDHLLPLTGTGQEPVACARGMSSAVVVSGRIGCSVGMSSMTYKRIGIGNASHVVEDCWNTFILSRQTSLAMLRTPHSLVTAVGIRQRQGQTFIGGAACIGCSGIAHIGDNGHGGLAVGGGISYRSIHIAVAGDASELAAGTVINVAIALDASLLAACAAVRSIPM